MSDFTNAEKAKEAKRELDMRKRVYSENFTVTPGPQQRLRIAIMQEIMLEYRAKAEEEEKAGRLL
jgi:hypothetical protein